MLRKDKMIFTSPTPIGIHDGDPPPPLVIDCIKIVHLGIVIDSAVHLNEFDVPCHCDLFELKLV